MLQNPLLPRLLKKVQMQGGARGEVRDVLGPYVAAPRERGGTHRRWVSADGPFSAACYAAGSENRNTDPFPGALSTSTELPWASTICRTTARPMPTPPYCRVRVLSTW